MLQTMFYTLTKMSSAGSASCMPRVYAYLNNSGMDGTITQEVEMNDNSARPGFPSNSKTLMWLKADHNQPDYENYSAPSVVQSILKIGPAIDAHSDVRKFGGECMRSWGFHTNVEVLIIVFSFALQYICIYL